jgi:hypothetical protein
MQSRTTHTPTSRRSRWPRAVPAQDLLSALDRDEQAARELAINLAALVRAGLVDPAGQDDELRFAVVEPRDGAA